MDQQLLNSYTSTIYRVSRPQLDIVIGQYSPLLDQFLMDNNAYCWAFVSAGNPFSKLLDEKENEILHEKMKDLLEFRGYSYVEGLGIPNNSDWPPEKSLFILDINLLEAKQLAMQFEQNAIVFGLLNEVPQLVITTPIVQIKE